MNYISLIILFVSINGLANGTQNFTNNNFFENSDTDISEENAPNPVEGQDPEDAPISDYQYALLASALGLGVIGAFKHKKSQTA